MSGGSLNYFYASLVDHVGDFGDKELDKLVEDLAELFYAREWYLSGDTGIGEWRESRDDFKKKWFTDHGRDEVVNTILKEMVEEIREQFGLQTERCQNCVSWTEEKEKYGRCALKRHCLTHRSDNCELYERREVEDE